MSDLLSYELFHSDDRLGYFVDDEGKPSKPGWYYQFEGDEPVGPFLSSGRAETAAEAEVEEYGSALAAEDAITY